MVKSRRSVCLITPNMGVNNVRLQPWRYLFEVAKQLNRMGHLVTFIGNVAPEIAELPGIRVQRLRSTRNLRWKENRILTEAVRQVNADVTIWHVGLTHFLYQNFELGLAKPAIGILTSPLYRVRDLKHLGLRKVIAGYRLSAMACVGSLLPDPFLRNRMRDASLDALVVQTHTTYRNLKRTASMVTASAAYPTRRG